jgi:copper transport protein
VTVVLATVVAVRAIDLTRSAHPRARTRALITGFAAVAASIAALAGGSPAGAQSSNSLQSISPANGDNLGASPEAIVLSFNQELRSDDRPIVELSCSGQPQNLAAPEVDDEGLVVTITVLQPVPKGVCIVSWRLADSAGDTFLGPETVTFRVDSDPPPTTAAAAATTPGATPTTSPFTLIPTGQGGSSTSSADVPNQGSNGGALWLGRLLSTLGIMALFGGLALIALGWPEGPEYVVTVRYLRAVWLLALVGSVLYLIAFAAKFGDLSFGGAMNPSAWLDLKDAGWPGRGALLRLALVAGCGWVATRPERIIDPTSAMWAWGLPGASLLAVALSRVDGPMAWIGVLIGFAHLLVGAVWFGGVALVCRVVLAGPGEEDLLHATRSFSRMSTKAMVAVVVTGVIQMLRLVGNPFSSSHGQVLLLKVVAVAAMLAVGLEARRQVAFRLNRAHEMTVPLADRFRRAFGAEAAIGVVVLAFSGWLLQLTPAKIDPLADESYSATLAFVDPTAGIDATLLIGPGRVGLNGFRLEINAPQDGIANVSLRFVPPAGSNGRPVRQPITLTTAGTAVLETETGIPFDVAGQWTLEFSAATATGVLQAATQTFNVVNPDGSQLTIPAQQTVAPVAPVAPQVSVIDQTTTTAPFVTTTLAPATTTIPG